MDIKLDSITGDLLLTSFDNNFSLVEDNDELANLLKRAVQTPKGWLGRTIIDSNGIRFIDKDFGDEIYKELSEGLTINFIARVKQHIIKAIEFLKLDVGVTSVVVNVVNDFDYGVDVSIYFDNSNIINLNVPL